MPVYWDPDVQHPCWQEIDTKIEFMLDRSIVAKRPLIVITTDHSASEREEMVASAGDARVEFTDRPSAYAADLTAWVGPVTRELLSSAAGLEWVHLPTTTEGSFRRRFEILLENLQRNGW